MDTRLGHPVAAPDGAPKTAALHLEDERAQQLLEQLCEQGRIGVVIAHRGHTVVAVRFLSVTEKQLVVAASGPLAVELRSASVAAVSFYDDLRVYSFLARVEGLERPENELPRLRFTLPDLITGVEGDLAMTRQSFRIPLKNDDVDVWLDCDGEKVRVEPVDISLGGILVELPDGAPTLAYRQRLLVLVDDGDQRLVLRAEVRNEQGSEVGLHFYEFGQEVLYRPPQDYRRLVTSLERRWLRKRQ